MLQIYRIFQYVVLSAIKIFRNKQGICSKILQNFWYFAHKYVILQTMEKIILGIDPGTNLMGYGVIKVTDGKAEMITMGVIDLRKFADGYLKLGHIFERVTGIINAYLPDEMAIEAPFFGKNVQTMLKLGRAQGTAIAAAIHHGVPIHEYAPMKIKMAITGNGAASKEQVAGMLQRLLKFDKEALSKFMDATDALGAAYCHYMQMNRPESQAHYKGASRSNFKVLRPKGQSDQGRLQTSKFKVQRCKK